MYQASTTEQAPTPTFCSHFYTRLKTLLIAYLCGIIADTAT